MGDIEVMKPMTQCYSVPSWAFWFLILELDKQPKMGFESREQFSVMELEILNLMLRTRLAFYADCNLIIKVLKRQRTLILAYLQTLNKFITCWLCHLINMHIEFIDPVCFDSIE